MTEESVREYERIRPTFHLFCEETKRIIVNSFAQSMVRSHSIEARSKSVDSFARKARTVNGDDSLKYSDPLRQLTDLAGVRIIVDTLDDIGSATAFIESNLDVIEQRDGGEERVEKGEFGYQSIHYFVRMTNDRIALPEFKSFDGMICEIQVRTVLQHAWAEIEHDIQYKGSQNIPKSVRRKFLSLAGLLEIADREFSSIQREDNAIKKGVLSDLQTDLTLGEIQSKNAKHTNVKSSDNWMPDSTSNVRTLISNGDYDEAVRMINQKLALEPSNYTLFLARARANFLAGDTEKAVQDLDTAEGLRPSDHRTADMRARILNGTLREPSAPGENEANQISMQGDVALKAGKPEEAFMLYSDALTKGASWPFTTLRLSLASAAAGDFEGARILLDQLRINPGTPMEINIVALQSIILANKGDPIFELSLIKLKSLLIQKNDFQFDLSPLKMLCELDSAATWGDCSQSVDRVFGLLSGASGW